VDFQGRWVDVVTFQSVREPHQMDILIDCATLDVVQVNFGVVPV
jgi:hypothetical protein